ncbi:TetR/AcrR family transcriptional regulator [Rhodococcus sp. HM1]|nr:TetR/AcrR family transcriptional regulator [Rhodococcus sp. HM1]MCK8671341.1 TetR/AcrR family transcriptional regulator [Rhodococcus sp. HM1]
MSEPTALGRRERNKLRTRQRMLDAARRLFAERGVDGSTIEDIADLAGVSRATVFNYFPSKDDLITALHASHMDALTTLIDQLLAQDLTTAERIAGVFADFARESRRYPGYMRAVTGEIERDLGTPDTARERTQRFDEQMLRIVEPGVERGEVRTDYPLPFLAQMVGAVYVSTLRHWRQNPDDDGTESFDRAARFAADALAPGTGSGRGHG